MRRGCSTQLHNVSFYQTYCILLAKQGSRSPRVGNYPLCVAMFAPGFQGSEKGIFKNDKQFLDIIIINHFHIIRNFLGAIVRENSSIFFIYNLVFLFFFYIFAIKIIITWQIF